MKKLLFLFLFLFSNHIGSIAQNFRCVDPSHTRFFIIDNSSHRVKAIRIDTAYSIDSAYFYVNFTTVRDTGGVCIDVNGPSWIGKGILEMQEGHNVFFNKQNDSIKIKTKAQTGESWIMYKFANGSYIQATVSVLALEFFCGFTDSVKTISMQCKNAANQNISHILNGITLKLSKNYGLIQLVEFYDFPNCNYPYNMTNVHVPTRAEIYNWEVDDEFHFKTESSVNNMPQYTLITIMNVIQKNIGVSYLVDEQKWETIWDWNTNPSPTLHTAYTRDTISYPVGNSYPVTLLPEESDYDYYASNDISLTSDTSNCAGGTWVTSSASNYYFDENSDSCWKDIAEPCYNVRNYICGIGETWSTGCPHYWQATSKKLVFYKKGAVVCGTPINVKEYADEFSKVSVFPNPTAEKINLQVSHQFREITVLKIYDCLGQLQLEKTADFFEVDMSSLTRGLYFLVLSNIYNERLTVKIIKE